MFYYLTYQDQIKNLEGYIFEKFFTIKKIWDGLQRIYHVRTDMRRSFVGIFVLHSYNRIGPKFSTGRPG